MTLSLALLNALPHRRQAPSGEPVRQWLRRLAASIRLAWLARQLAASVPHLHLLFPLAIIAGAAVGVAAVTGDGGYSLGLRASIIVMAVDLLLAYVFVVDYRRRRAEMFRRRAG
jgi:hypothetical protein